MKNRVVSWSDSFRGKSSSIQSDNPGAVMRCLLFLVLVVSASSAALGQESKEAFKILSDALAYQKGAATEVTTQAYALPDDTKTEIKKFRKTSPDGSVLSRTEDVSTNSDPGKKRFFYRQIYITNADGSWQIDEKTKTALSLKYSMERDKQIARINGRSEALPMFPNNDFRLEEVLYKGQPCLKVVMTLEGQIYQEELAKCAEINSQIIESQIKQVYGATDADRSAKRPVIPEPRNQVPNAYEFIVNKDGKIIWSVKRYAANGALLSVDEFSTVEYGVPLADGLFEIPEGYQTKVISSLAEYLQFQMENSKIGQNSK